MANDTAQPNTIASLQMIVRACTRCCGHFTATESGMECSRIAEPKLETPAQPCSLPALYTKVVKGTSTPDKITLAIVDAAIPKFVTAAAPSPPASIDPAKPDATEGK